MITIAAAQMLRFLTKLPKYKDFDYKPIYYNEEKEDLHNRVEAALKGQDPKVEMRRGALKTSWSKHKRSSSSGARSNPLFIGLLIGLGLIAYILFYS